MARKPPWKQANPKARAGASRKLAPLRKAAAKRRAQRAGRPYPNLVDNMQAARGGAAKRKHKAKR